MFFIILTSFVLLQNKFIEADRTQDKVLIDVLKRKIVHLGDKEDTEHISLEKNIADKINHYCSKYYQDYDSPGLTNDFSEEKHVQFNHDFSKFIDLIKTIPCFVHPLIARLKLALLTKIDYFLTDIYYKLYVGYYPEVDFNPFSRIILHEINNIKDSELEEFEKKLNEIKTLTEEESNHLKRFKISYIENKQKEIIIGKLGKFQESTEEDINEFNKAENKPDAGSFTKYFTSKAETDKHLQSLFESFNSTQQIDQTKLNEYLTSKAETDEYIKMLNVESEFDNVETESIEELIKSIQSLIALIKYLKSHLSNPSSIDQTKKYYFDDFMKKSDKILDSQKIKLREDKIKGAKEELENQRIDKAMQDNKYYQRNVYYYKLFKEDYSITERIKAKDLLLSSFYMIIFFNWKDDDGYCYNITSFDQKKQTFTFKIDGMYSNLEKTLFAQKLKEAEEAAAAAKAEAAAAEEAAKAEAAAAEEAAKAAAAAEEAAKAAAAAEEAAKAAAAKRSKGLAGLSRRIGLTQPSSLIGRWIPNIPRTKTITKNYNN